MPIHDVITILEFFAMLLSPCASATMVTLRWDKAEAAYLRFEQQLALLMEPKPKPVADNLHIRPYEAWTFHCTAEPLESAAEFRLRVFGPRKSRTAPPKDEIVAPAAEVKSVEIVAA